jgi:hypothetical protein
LLTDHIGCTARLQQVLLSGFALPQVALGKSTIIPRVPDESDAVQTILSSLSYLP